MLGGKFNDTKIDEPQVERRVWTSRRSLANNTKA